MKLRNIIFYIFILISSSSSMQAQNNTTCCCKEDAPIKCFNPNTDSMPTTYTVLYDFKTKNISFPKNGYKNLKRGDAIKIKVINLNPFIYKAVINSTDSSYKAMVDANNLLSAFGTLSNLTSIVSGITNSAITSPVYKGGTPGGTIPFLQWVTVPQLPPDTNQNQKKSDSLSKSDSLTLNNFFKTQKDNINSINARIIQLKNLIDSKSYDWQRLLSAERNPFPDCNNFNKLTSGNYIIDIIKGEFKIILETDHECLNNISKYQIEYLTKSAGYNDILVKVDAGPFRLKDSLFKTFYMQAFATLTKVDSSLSYKNIEPITESLESIKGLKLCYTSSPIFLMSDSKIITIQVKPWKDTLPYITDAPITFELPWQQKHIWGVSGGIYGSCLHNDEFSSLANVDTTRNPHDTTYSLKKNNTGNGEFGIDALAYTGCKVGENIYAGASFGAGLSLESKPKPRIFLGGSLMYGNKNRIIFSFGYVAGFVDELSAVYQNNTTGLLANPVNVTNSIMKMKFFFSLNYSFLNN